MNLIEKLAGLRRQAKQKYGAHAKTLIGKGRNAKAEASNLESLLNPNPKVASSVPTAPTPPAPPTPPEDYGRLAGELVHARADIARLKAELAQFDGVRTDLLKAHTDLASANAKIADFDNIVEVKASMRAQHIMAAAGGVPITMSATARPAAQKGESAGLTGLARVKAAIREETQQNQTI